jgi:hypothetical protein
MIFLSPKMSMQLLELEFIFHRQFAVKGCRTCHNIKLIQQKYEIQLSLVQISRWSRQFSANYSPLFPTEITIAVNHHNNHYNNILPGAVFPL